MKKSDIFWQTYLNLEREALEVSKYIFFTDEVLSNSDGGVVAQPCNTQLEAFSPYIADLLVRCCVQIEAISKELYFDNGGTKVRGDSNILFDEDCLKLIDIKWKTHNKTVVIVSPSFNFTKDENRILKPLKKAHKRQGTCWEKAYQAVKHDRYSSLQKGNVKAFIRALAALYLLNVYYRNDSWVTKYQDIAKGDYRLGSAIFSVVPPATDRLWYDNTPISNESPFVAKYRNSDYRRIEEMQQNESQALDAYWKAQPELQEPAFIAQLQAASDTAKNNPSKRIMPIWELAKYRLNKLIPQTLSLEDKKKLLLNSDAWKCRIHQQNKHLPIEEITADNIQSEIDSVATHWGIDIMDRYQKLEWLQLALSGNICEIYIE